MQTIKPAAGTLFYSVPALLGKYQILATCSICLGVWGGYERLSSQSRSNGEKLLSCPHCGQKARYLIVST